MRHVETGRRRPEGDRSKEYINLWIKFIVSGVLKW
jgi:hypothetical protein